MANVERGNVRPPNETNRGDRRNSCGPMQQHGSMVQGSNDKFMRDGAANNGFIPMTRHAATVKGSNQDLKFSVENAKMPQPASAVEPGKGAIPVNPFVQSGKPAKITTAELDAPARGR